MGRVIERRFVFREAEDVEREARVTASSAGVGGGDISGASSIGGHEGITAMLCRFLRVLRLILALVLVIASFSAGFPSLESVSEPS